MITKLSETQVIVLGHMARGHKLYCSVHGVPWLDGIPGKQRGTSLTVHTNTWVALWKKGCIMRKDAENVPFWRRDYVISDAGRRFLREALEEEAKR